MAEWTSVKSLGATAEKPITDGTKIYWLQDTNTLNAYSWDETTEVQMSSLGSYSEVKARLVCFKGSIYYARRNSATEVTVRRWNGSSFDTVLTITGGATAFLYEFLGDENRLSLFVTVDGTSSTRTSTDGDNWTTDGFTWSDSYLVNSTAPFNAFLPSPAGDRGNMFARMQAGIGADFRFYELVGTTWTRRGSDSWSTPTTYDLQAVNQDALWRKDTGASTYQYSSAGTSWSTPAANSGYIPLQGLNLAASFAYTYNGGSGFNELYQWDGSAWQLDDASVNNGTIITGAGPVVIRLNSNNVYAFLPTSLSRAFWQRDPDITGDDYGRGGTPSTTAQLYLDTGSGLTYVSDLPWAGLTNPDCLVERESGVLVAGSSAAQAEMIAQAASPFTTWADITGSYPDTDPVKTVREV